MILQEQFNLLCQAMNELLEREYEALQARPPVDIGLLLQEKRDLATRISALHPQLQSLTEEEAAQLRPLIEKIQQLSERNMVLLKGRIDGLQEIIDLLRQREITGAYGPDGLPVTVLTQGRLLETA